MNNYGKCNFCGASNTRSQRTGKIYCSQKCWLGEKPSLPQHKESPNWENIRKEKSENIQHSLAFKEAVSLAIAVYQKGEVQKEELRALIELYYSSFKEMQNGKINQQDISENDF